MRRHLAIAVLSLVLLAGCHHMVTGYAYHTQIPRDVVKFIDHRESCHYFLTQRPHEDERTAFVTDQSAKYCIWANEAELNRLRAKYAKREDVQLALDAAETCLREQH